MLYEIEVIDDCLECGKCIDVCLVGALRSEGNFTLIYDSEVCVDCGVCVVVCDNGLVGKLVEGVR